MIYWRGKTTDGIIHYHEEGKTFQDLYENIQNKYGWDNIIDSYAYELKFLEINGYDSDKFLDPETREFDANLINETIDQIMQISSHKELTDLDFKAIIEDSTSQAYYHNFEIEN